MFWLLEANVKKLLNKFNHLSLLIKSIRSLFSITPLLSISISIQLFTLIYPRLHDHIEHAIHNVIGSNTYTHVLMTSTTFGKDLLPRIAAQYDSQPITDITDIQVIDPPILS